MEPQIFIDTELSGLMDKVADYQTRGWRFTNLSGSSVEREVELLYTFSFGQELENLKILVDNEQQVPSISSTYPNAFYFENEVSDLFGVQFTGIIIDYEGGFYTTSIPTPMNPSSLEAEEYLAEEASDE